MEFIQFDITKYEKSISCQHLFEEIKSNTNLFWNKKTEYDYVIIY